MRKVTFALFACIAAFLAFVPPTSAAETALDHIVIIGEGAKGAEISIPRDTTVAIRAEGRDAAGNPVPIDATKIVWRASSSGPRTNRSFRSKFEGGKVHVTALRDAFDTEDGAEPSAMLTAEFEGKSAAVVLYSVLNVEGHWTLFVTSDVIDMNLRQSGRWIKDDKGRMGTITGKKLVLRVTETISVLGIPVSKTLEPKIDFTSRDAGNGTVEVPFKTEKLRVQRVSPSTP